MKRKEAAAGVVGNARKWITGIITTLAALMALMVNARNLGLSPWLGLFDPNYADRAARRIVLTPRSDTLRAIGDTALVTATVTDARGATLAGATLRWRSSDSGVASVDSTGVIVARSPGRSIVEVSVWEVTARVAVLVRPVPVTVALAGDTARRMADGDTLQLVASVRDGRGHPMPLLAPTWRSSDSLVARVDSTGLVQARAAGRARIVAAFGTLDAGTEVEVVLTPAQVQVERGDTQRALAGRRLREPIVLRVMTRLGQPVPGAGVTFATGDGEGTLSNAVATTDPQGRARVAWTLGARAGRHQLLVRIPMLDSALVVSADADPLPGNTRVEVLSKELHGGVGAPLAHAVQARVTDSLGVALADVRVAWTTPDGGTIAGATHTDTMGIAEARWTLGSRAGPQRLLLQVGDPRFIAATTVRALAEAGPAAALTVLSGDLQRARGGDPLPKPVVVVVRDSSGNPVSGATVRGLPAAGTLTDSTLLTGADGRAVLHWTLGPKASRQQLELRLQGTDRRATVEATARAGAPAAITLTAARAATNGSTRLVARVTDANGNPIPAAAIAVTSSAGTLDAARFRTDTAGRAVVTWRPGTAVRSPVRVVATVVGTTVTTSHAVP